MLKLNTKVIENFVAEEECNIATTTRVTAAVAADIIATQRLLSYIILLVCFINFSPTTTAIFCFQRVINVAETRDRIRSYLYNSK